MPSIFSTMGAAWDFYRKQPVLNHVLFWMFIVPLTLMLIMSDVIASPIQYWILEQSGLSERGLFVLIALANLLVSIWVIWGNASVLVVGTRIIKSPAGRTRYSFQAVRKEASHYIIPLLLTDILRDCFTFLWAILLIVPGIIYRVRTIFYPIMLVLEGHEYRGALQASKEVVKGHSWRVFWYMVGIMILIGIPTVVGIAIASSLVNLAPQLLVVSDFLVAAVSGFGLMMYLLMNIVFYKHVKEL